MVCHVTRSKPFLIHERAHRVMYCDVLREVHNTKQCRRKNCWRATTKELFINLFKGKNTSKVSNIHNVTKKLFNGAPGNVQGKRNQEPVQRLEKILFKVPECLVMSYDMDAKRKQGALKLLGKNCVVTTSTEL